MLQNRIALRNRILKWFDGRERNLPWLEKRSAYGVWVSEIMLQQTQIGTVIDYYKRFIRRFPNVRKLAAADEQSVLAIWEGLGYYRRARQLHTASQVIVEQHHGEFPTEYDDVLALPGIGRYTAGAILSISMDKKLPILEGNTIRLFSRWIGLREDAFNRESQNRLWAISESLLPNSRAGDFNQALMDFGREVCRPKNPVCEKCCVSQFCFARIQNCQHEIPHRAAKIKYEDLNESIILIQRRDKVLMRKCRKGERWAGLWDFPRMSHSDPNTTTGSIQNRLQEATGLSAEVSSLDYTIKHAVTRFRIRLDCLTTSRLQGRLKRDSGYVWKSIEEIESLPLSVTGRKFAKKFL